MNKTVAGMIGAVGALMVAGQGLAAPVAPLSASTVVQADQARADQARADQARADQARAEIVQGPAHDGDAVVQQAQYYYRHHHRYYRRHYRRYYR